MECQRTYEDAQFPGSDLRSCAGWVNAHEAFRRIEIEQHCARLVDMTVECGRQFAQPYLNLLAGVLTVEWASIDIINQATFALPTQSNIQYPDISPVRLLPSLNYCACACSFPSSFPSTISTCFFGSSICVFPRLQKKPVETFQVFC